VIKMWSKGGYELFAHPLGEFIVKNGEIVVLISADERWLTPMIIQAIEDKIDLETQKGFDYEQI
jgi:hypothetical protein